MRTLFCYIILAYTLFLEEVVAFTPCALFQRKVASCSLCASSQGNVERPANEFSRVFNTESVLYRRRDDYEATVTATEEELELLANRFKLPGLGSLQADVGMTLQDEGCVRVKGVIYGKVTQTCVRTNVDFENDFNYDFYTVMRPVDSSLIETAVEYIPYEAKKSRKKKKEYKTAAKKMDEMGMKELQNMMKDFDIEDEVIEDAAVYDNGMLDLGELVAQIFRVKLDPFPKMPDSKPIDMEFTL